MSEERKNSGGAGCFIMAVASFLAPILYILSSGPVGLIFVTAGWPKEWWDTIYFPMSFLVTKFPPSVFFINWWVKAWTGW